ncbi:MAG: metallophosphoesterase [Chloroflexota bacterium]
MTRAILTFSLIVTLLVACAPATTPILEPAPVLQPTQTPLVSNTAAATPESTSTEQTPPEATKKPKGQKTPPASDSAKKPQAKNPPLVPTSTDPNYIAAEISGRPTDQSITINIVPAIDMQIFIAYGTTSGNYTEKTAPASLSANTPHEIELTNLTPDTAYYYEVVPIQTGGALISNSTARLENTFHTQRGPGSAFTFDIQGDSHPERLGKQFDPALYTRTLTGAASDQPDFFMTIGDDFSVDTLKTVNAETVTAQYINQRQWLGLVGAPIFLVNGNHEQASLANLNGTADNVSVLAQTARNAYFPQPAPDTFFSGDTQAVEFIGPLRDYYAFTWGDALFVVIDPYWHSPQSVDNQFGADRSTDKKNRDLWNVTLGDTQYQWFKQTLETSTAKYKFVFTHHVLGTGRGGIELANGYEWGDSANLSAHRPGWDKTIHQVMVENGVTIFFQGHDHIFVKQELDGVIYQSLPEPANPFYSWENADAYKTGDKFPNSGRVRVNVSPDGVQVDYVRSYLDKADELAFSYTVK